MQIFRQWYDDKQPVFNREIEIYFSQCNEKHELSLSEMLRMTSDTGVEDYNERGMSWQTLADHDALILVSRMALRFHKMPVANETIVLKTWEEKPQPLQLIRAYEFMSKDGVALVSGISSWIIVNPKTRRIVRTKDFTLREPPEISLPHDCMDCGKIIVPDQMTELNQRPICYSDIDGNGHTNNSRYGAFTVDCLPPEYQQKQFTDFRINFSKEAMKGEMLQMYGHADAQSHKVTVTGRQGNDTCFESELFYRV